MDRIYLEIPDPDPIYWGYTPLQENAAAVTEPCRARAPSPVPRRWLCALFAFCAALLHIGCSASARPAVKFGLGVAAPLMYIDSNGKPAGFFVDAIQEAGDRAGYEIQWAPPGNMPSNTDALRRGAIDIINGPTTPERIRNFHVTSPWWYAELVALVPAAGPLTADQDLNGRTLAVLPPVVSSAAHQYTGSRPLPFSPPLSAAEAVCAGKAEAAIVPSVFLGDLVLRSSPVCRDFPLRAIYSQAPLEFSLISRRALAPVAHRLKDALDDMAADGTLAFIAARHPPISTSYAARLMEMPRLRFRDRTLLIGLLAVSLVALVCGVFFYKQRKYNARLERDLIARMRAESALRSSEGRFRALFDSAPQTVLAIDNEGVVQFANQRVEAMFGVPRPVVIGANAETLFPERFRPQFSAGRLQGVRDAAGLRADGTEFPIEVSLGPVNTAEGLTLAFLADISDRVALERQLLLSQKLESLGRMTGGVAHDFNNLLTVILGYSQLAIRKLAPHDALRPHLDEIIHAGDRAAALTGQLLAFSRRQPGKRQAVSLNNLLAGLQNMLRNLIGESIELAISLDPETPAIEADPTQIEQVVVNLVLNARDALNGHGRISIETRLAPPADQSAAPARCALLCVSDNGVGMSDEIQAHIFEPFFTTKEQGKGTGLGLPTVYGIVEQHKGTIKVSSAPGLGTTFEIRLPAAPATGVEPAAEFRPLSARPGTETVLVAEDEPGLRKFFAEILGSSGYSVLEAANGREALERIAAFSGTIHLLLTDLIMPQMGGVDLARKFQELFPRRPVLLISGYTADPLPDDLAADLISKPCSAADLLNRVRDALDRAASPSAASAAHSS